MKTDSQKIIKKIEALLRKAQSAEEISNMEEANAFYGKASELMLKYNIEQAELNSEDEEKKKDEIIATGHKNGIQYKHRAAIDLISVIARHQYCSIILPYESHIRESGGVNIIGRKSQVELCMYMYDVISRIFSKLASKDWRKYQLVKRKTV